MTALLSVEDSIDIAFYNDHLKKDAHQTLSDYNLLQVSTSDFAWLQVKLKVATNNYEPNYVQMWVKTINCNWLQIKLQVYQITNYKLRVSLRVAHAVGDYKWLPLDETDLVVVKGFFH